MPQYNHIWWHNGTVNLTIKKIPQEVYETLKNAAAERGRSLNAQVIQVLAQAAEEAKRREFIRTSRPELERFVATLPRMSSSVPLIREDRKRH
jgi:uncharacterized protein (DUF1778 family)